MVWCIISSVLYFAGSTGMCFILIYIIISFKVINVKNHKIEKKFKKKKTARYVIFMLLYIFCPCKIVLLTILWNSGVLVLFCNYEWKINMMKNNVKITLCYQLHYRETMEYWNIIAWYVKKNRICWFSAHNKFRIPSDNTFVAVRFYDKYLSRLLIKMIFPSPQIYATTIAGVDMTYSKIVREWYL